MTGLVIGRPAVEAWVRAYVRAWESNEPADIAELFAAEAVYRPTPFSDGWRGRDAIVERWLERKDVPGTWTFEWAVVAADGDVGIVEGRTTYRDPQAEYSNIWLIRFDATAQCREFVEWWVDRALGDPGQPG